MNEDATAANGADGNGQALLRAIEGLIPPLLDGLDALRFAARHLHPLHLAQLAAAVMPTERPLREGLAAFRQPVWPPRLRDLHDRLDGAAEAALQAFDGLRSAGETGETGAAWRSLRLYADACDLLWPVARLSPPVSRFFLDDAARRDAALAARVDAAEEQAADCGVFHIDNDRGSRGGWSLFLPAHPPVDAPEPPPLIVALHGGRGHGRVFLWSWLPAARAAGAMLIAPTATGTTWALQGEDGDTPNLLRILREAAARRPFDPKRVLLTGMSDGGTFCWVTGLLPSPFTHLAPFSASFHPLLLEFADPQRLRCLPVHIVHGTQDWMFPPEIAQTAARSLRQAGARVTHREIADLPHCFATDETAAVLRWFLDEPAVSPASGPGASP